MVGAAVRGPLWPLPQRGNGTSRSDNAGSAGSAGARPQGSPGGSRGSTGVARVQEDAGAQGGLMGRAASIRGDLVRSSFDWLTSNLGQAKQVGCGAHALLPPARQFKPLCAQTPR
jgi:hypothetical protein